MFQQLIEGHRGKGIRILFLDSLLHFVWLAVFVLFGNVLVAGELKEPNALPPEPLLPIPTTRQVVWQQTELAMFLHFGVNNFTNREWGTGREDPAIFNPQELDAQQWARVAKSAGFGKLILTAKHHDGFCLWPSQYTDHSVKNSPWKAGKGDVVAELAAACKEFGLQMGLYLSPWDRHEPTYGDTRLYNQFYLAQLRELLTNYGPLSEIWFDGAKGKNAKDMQYHFDAFWSLVRQLQPGAVMFSDEGPDVRWIGNEHGFAGEICWSMINRKKVSIGKADTRYLNSGEEAGPDWVPGECDVSIRKGWFWHPDQHPKTVEQLLDIYFKSVGRNGVLLLNVPPDPRGLISEEDVQRLGEFRNALDKIFSVNLAGNANVLTSTYRGKSPVFSGSQVIDGKMQTYWATDDSIRTGWVELDLARAKEFNVVEIREPVTFGQRVQEYRIEIFKDGNWKTISSGTTIGNKKLIQFKTVRSRLIRLVISKSKTCPLIAELGIFIL